MAKNGYFPGTCGCDATNFVDLIDICVDGIDIFLSFSRFSEVCVICGPLIKSNDPQMTQISQRD